MANFSSSRHAQFWRTDWFTGLLVVFAVFVVHKSTNLGGVTLFQMLAGVLPFRGESMAELMYRISSGINPMPTPPDKTVFQPKPTVIKPGYSATRTDIEI